ncbi:hypothetical protein TNCT_293331 [Trichonephila clavata]|uniref:Uncharacterized protein n=1 Tax=Trichonephila clavata TaxID=2740835 RepID=A0A8X6HTT4_TRICU|nr:hypothetical protein TNCT_293331 [Trichonephila clavata]
MEADEDLKILARIRSKERMQATRKRRKEEQVKQSGTRYNSPRTLGKAVAKVKHNESINEESPPSSHQASKSPAEANRKIDGTVCASVLPKDICAGLYVLVQLFCKSGNNKKLLNIAMRGYVSVIWMKMGKLEYNC